jgi:hypothetical protein
MRLARDIGCAGDMHSGAWGFRLYHLTACGQISLLRKQKYHIALQYIIYFEISHCAFAMFLYYHNCNPHNKMLTDGVKYEQGKVESLRPYPR